MPFLRRFVFITAILDLVSKLRVLLRNPDLPLKPLLLVVQLTDAVLEQLGLFQNELVKV